MNFLICECFFEGVNVGQKWFGFEVLGQAEVSLQAADYKQPAAGNR
jgi:hypothetical protein